MDSKLRYEGVNDIISELTTISSSNEQIGKLFESTINSFESNASLSSKVITPNMKNMIDNINKINSEIKEHSEKYCEFLNKDVNIKYDTADEKIRNIWVNVQSIYDASKE